MITRIGIQSRGLVERGDGSYEIPEGGRKKRTKERKSSKARGKRERAQRKK